MNTRTQIYLSDEQRRALKMLAASSDATVSDLVRRAVDRLLSEEFAGKNWEREMRAVVERLRASGPPISEASAVAAVKRYRARKRREAS